VIYLAGVAAEHTWPARRYAVVPWWKTTCIVFSLAGGMFAMAARAVLSSLVGDVAMFDGRSLGALGIPVGVLSLTLSDGSYSWKFLPIAGQSYSDSGSDDCH